MRLLAIGDIHGHRMAFEALLEEVRPTSADKVVFLGDYVDKGPDVAGTLDLLCELGEQNDWVFLRGNHDQLMIDAIRDPATLEVWECLSGGAPLVSYGPGLLKDQLLRVPGKHVRFLEERCRDFYETDS